MSVIRRTPITYSVGGKQYVAIEMTSRVNHNSLFLTRPPATS